MRIGKHRQELLAEAGRAMQAYQRSTQAFDDAVGAALRLNPSDLRGLDWLMEGPRSAGELSKATGLSLGAVTELIDRLERRKFVRRRRDEADRRRVLVEMTPAGRRQVDRFYGPMVAEGMGLFEGVTDEQIAFMRDWLIGARELTDRHRAGIGK